jgi:cysteine desulfurase/selenocysteine lyase
MLDLASVRADFPILAEPLRGRRLVYLDNAATTQKPRQVIEAISRFYAHDNANVHRGVHELSRRATLAYEGARERVGRFLGTADRREVIFTRGTTEAINLVARSFLQPRLRPGDEVLLTALEHHSNIVPWQLVCEEVGARLVVAPMDEKGELVAGGFAERLGPRTRLAAVTAVSNALGTVLPVAELAAAARAAGVPLLVDAAQAAAHLPLDVRSLGADFLAFSGHKAYGPTGIGVLWGRRELLEEMRPWQGGGDMILSVTFEKSTFAPLPARLEAGTQHVAGAVGLAAALDWIDGVGLEAIRSHEAALYERAGRALATVPGLRLVGQAAERVGAQSFTMAGAHPHDIATILDEQGIAVRAGHHCAQPVMDFLGLPATTRASFAVYSGEDDIEALIEGLGLVASFFGPA